MNAQKKTFSTQMGHYLDSDWNEMLWLYDGKIIPSLEENPEKRLRWFQDLLKEYIQHSKHENADKCRAEIEFIERTLQQKQHHTTVQAGAKKNEIHLTEIGVLCYYNNRAVTITNDIAIAKEYGIITKKHTVNTWHNKASGNDLKPGFIERRQALHHVHRLEHILESGYLNADKIEQVEKDIRALKKSSETEK